MGRREMRSRMTCLFGAFAVCVLTPAIAAAAGIEEIEYFHRVSDRVALGGQPNAGQVAALAPAGFRAIVNLREDGEVDGLPEAEAAKDAGLVYVRVPVSPTSPTDPQVETFLRVTDDADIYPAFIHCATANRAAALWMVRRVLRDGWSLEDAENEAVHNGLTSKALLEFAREYVRRVSRQEAD